jgi:hypothetical protein
MSSPIRIINIIDERPLRCPSSPINSNVLHCLNCNFSYRSTLLNTEEFCCKGIYFII